MESLDLLLQQLESPEPALRQDSAKRLGLLGDVRAAHQLIRRLIEDDDGIVRRAIAIALGNLGDKHALQPLVHALHNDHDAVVRRRAAMALGELGDKLAIEPLVVALKDTASGVPGYAAIALDTLGESWKQPFHQRLGETDRNVRVRVILSLAHFNYYSKRPFGVFISAANDEDTQVRWIAISCLAEIDPKRAANTLITALKDDSSRQKAAEALGAIKERRAVPALVEILWDSKDEAFAWTGWAAADALANIGDERAIEPLRSIIEKGTSAMRASASWALGHFGEAGFRCLLNLLKHVDNKVRWWAISGLGYCGEAAFEYVVDALHDEDKEVRAHAVHTLREMNPERAVMPLILALQDEDSDVRWDAAQRLGQLGNEQAVPALQFVRDHDKGETTYRAYTKKVSVVAADALWMIRRHKNPNLIKIDGVEYEFQENGELSRPQDSEQDI